MAKLNLECLGQLRITLGKKVLALPLKAQALLCYLAVSGRSHSREALVGLLWGELSEEAARANLRTMLPKLRQVLEPFLEISRETVGFNRASSYDLDVELFLGSLTDLEAEADIAMLRKAVTLYRGDFLEGFHVDGVPLFEEWLLGQRERLKQLQVQALHMLAVHHTERREYAAATDYLSRLLRLEPWREDSHRQLMTMLALSGQRDAALLQYRKCCQVLRDELGLGASAETTELYERIKAGEIEARYSPRHNLPLLPTTLIGRHAELVRVAEILTTCRLLTLVGPGGVGKTSLALQAARNSLGDFTDGVYFVPLVAIRDPELVTVAIAHVLEVQETTGRPLLESIKAKLHDKTTLLLLDNFEHLLLAAPVVAELLAHCPKLRVMITSRMVLNLRGEHELEVPPLALPDLRQVLYPEALVQYPAVALFCSHAKEGKPEFQLTNENAAVVAIICVRLDGLPLAIELAAARIKFMSPEMLLVRLTNRLKLLTGGARDLPLHQQTLRNTIAWSYELLEPEMQLLFGRLAVFVSSFSLEAAEDVCHTPNPLELDILEAVTRLADKSLLQREEFGSEVRFRMLETIREYALERLQESGEAETLRRQYAAFFHKMAERAELEMKGADQVRWLTSLETELDHLRAVLKWTFESGELETALSLAGALPWYWFTRGHFREGREWTEKALGLSGMTAPHLRAKVLYGAGMLARRQGNYQAAIAHLEAGLELFRQLNDESGMAACLHHLAHVAEAHGDYGEVIMHFKESLALARNAEDTWELSLTLNCLGHAAYAHGDSEWAAALLEESLLLCRAHSNTYGTADALRHLGLIALDSEDYRRATLLLEESLALQSELGNKQGMALLFAPLARAAFHSGEALRATMLLEQGLALRSEEDELGLVQCLNELAEVACAQGNYVGAARLLGATEALHEAHGAAMGRLYLDRHAIFITKLRRQLGNDAFAVAWAEGCAIGLEGAVALMVTAPTEKSTPVRREAQHRLEHP